MTRVLGIASQGGTLRTDDGQGIRAGLNVRGTGMPPVSNQWFAGAGDGESYRGSRVLPRVLDVPFKVYGDSRAAVWDRISLISRIFDPRLGPVRLTIELDGEEWYADVRREGGGDWSWGEDTDGSTYLKTIVTAKAGDPYWQRSNEESKNIVLGGLGRGLLKTTAGVDSLSKLRVSTTAAFGSVTFSNSGDVEAFGKWRVTAPFDGFSLISPFDEALTFEDTKTTGWIDVDMELGTITDELGENRYDGLAATPRFWTIPSGESEADVLVESATSDSRITVIWSPRKWVLF